jgi:hypothetical protein
VSRSRARELGGLAAVGIAVCCGLPTLLGAGAPGTAAGIVLGSTLVAAIGLTTAVVAIGLLCGPHLYPSCAPVDSRPATLSEGR